ncbi:MAG TPA: DNA-binding response regulator, partial [Candidatus Sulfotelmatobacter sp.]|nr:DNA-binding response regulator [Candidatus Sulfotelmatobacter sp.]
TVLVAMEGAVALTLVDKVTPDVILLDAVMPGMDGFETCRRLKREKKLEHVPVIFMTGLSETEHIVKGFEAGGVDYLTKPIIPDELIARIRAHLANARLAQSARIALDAAGRFLLAATRSGRVMWSTPQADKLLATVLAPGTGEPVMLPPNVQGWLRKLGDNDSRTEPVFIPGRPGQSELQLSFVGRIGDDELLLRLASHDVASDEEFLRQHLPLTAREAEVLLWIMRGKSNRDVATILGLSPRTVNKHLEQMFAKLGVENRTSAAALAVRTLGLR